MLLYVYVAALVLGGLLLVSTLFLGGDDGHGDAGGADGPDAGGGDLHGGGGAHAGHGGGGHGGGSHGGGGHGGHADHAGQGWHTDVWIPILSVRFWVFFLAFFGLTGTVMELLALAGTVGGLASAIGVGAAAGLGASWVVHRLGGADVGRVPTALDLRGREATVLLPMAPGERGKIRLLVQGSTVDLIARSTDEHALARGSRCLVYDFDGSVALVVSAPLLEP